MTATLKRLFKEREDGDNQEILHLLLCSKNKMREIARENVVTLDKPG
jgi:hypothetical protein